MYIIVDVAVDDSYVNLVTDFEGEVEKVDTLEHAMAIVDDCQKAFAVSINNDPEYIIVDEVKGEALKDIKGNLLKFPTRDLADVIADAEVGPVMVVRI
jgi:hypothetical protein